MRSGPIAVVALVAAALGAGAALGIGRATGWVGSGHARTILLSTPQPSGAVTTASARPSAKPLLGNGFDPALLYRRRSAGVVTIYAEFGSPASDLGQASQGSGFVVSPQGVILTNSHVITSAGEGGPVRAASRLYVEFSDHDRVPAAVVGWDLFDDVGVIRVDPKTHLLDPVPLGNSAA